MGINRVFFVIILSTILCSCGNKDLYLLEEELSKGDKKALFEIGEYFDNQSQIKIYRHEQPAVVSISSFAKDIVNEYCMFLPTEIVISDSTSKKEFLHFLNINEKIITFSELSNTFIITPFDKRKVDFEVLAIADSKRIDLENKKEKLLSSYQLKENGIDTLINEHNPKALLSIASSIVKGRNYGGFEEKIELIQYLTHTYIAVPNRKGDLCYQLENDYSIESKINLLIFFAKHYKQYVWDKERLIFTNPQLKAIPTSKVRELFDLLLNENDTIAMNAFIQLTTCNPKEVSKLAYEIRHNHISKNSNYFYKIEALNHFTSYCSQNNIRISLEQSLKNNILRLKKPLSTIQRYQLENQIIAKLTLENVTAYEYWIEVYSILSESNNSNERILNIFYAKNWEKLTSNNRYLDCYLKKSQCHNNGYSERFLNSKTDVIQKLKDYKTTDNDIRREITKVLVLNKHKPKKKRNYIKSYSNGIFADKYYQIQDFRQILHKKLKNGCSMEDIIEFLGMANYSQISDAIEEIENYKFENEDKYAFLENDFGFFNIDFDNKNERKLFLKNYANLTEYQLYSYYLDDAKIDYKNKDNSLNFDKIYDILKYDVVENSNPDGPVYSIIKLLEINFKTTLGYPKKLCNSSNHYLCFCHDRANAWMSYLTEKKLLKLNHDEPCPVIY